MEEVPKQSDLVRRGGVYYFRKRWPSALKREGSKEALTFSLRTSNYREALARLDEARQRAARIFRGEEAPAASADVLGIRRTFEPNQRPEGAGYRNLRKSEALELARAFYFDAIADLDANPCAANEMPKEDAVQLRRELEDRVAALSIAGPGRHRDDTWAVETSVLRKANAQADPNSEEGRLLRQYLKRAQIQIGRIRLARFDGDFSDTIQDIQIAGANGLAPTLQAANIKSITFGEARDLFFSQLSAGSPSTKTLNRYDNELRHIVAYFGASTLLSVIDAQACDQFRDVFSKLPPNFQRQLAKGRTHEELAAASRDGNKRLAWATLNKYLAMLSRFSDWASQRDYMAKNYAAHLSPLEKKPDRSVAKLPFQSEELQRLFDRPIYRGCVNDRLGFAKPGPNIIRRARYWAPLIALFAGLRCGEIMQLTPQHFRRSATGTQFIVLTKDMQLKNDNAEREIPVHPVLEQIGLIEWVNRRRNEPTARLFPDVPPDKHYDQPSSTFSKRFSTDLNHLELGDRRAKLTFHSLRHTFKSALDRGDIPEEKKDELCGWSRGKKQGRSYGDGLRADVLASSVAAVSYDINLLHLFRHRGRDD